MHFDAKKVYLQKGVLWNPFFSFCRQPIVKFIAHFLITGGWARRKYHHTSLMSFLAAGFVLAGSAEVKQLPAILIFSAKGELYETAIFGLKQELRNDCAFTVIEYTTDKCMQKLDMYFNSVTPNAVVIAGNQPLKLYRKYTTEVRKKIIQIPVISILAQDTKNTISVFDNAVGITFETPIITSLVSFRAVIKKPMKHVGLVYRKSFEESVIKHTAYCKKEKIVLSGVLLGNKPEEYKKEISDALHMLVKKNKIQALWLPNDTIILNPDLFTEVWLPFAANSRIPVIVGIESLVNPDLKFGTFAVIPEPRATGEQAAGIIFNLMENSWEMNGITVYPTISVFTILNLEKAKTITDSIHLHRVHKVLGKNECLMK
ncbi:MAG: hypothetical protein JW915_14870 [Chitinispirillaceae bacterium]|nr:hypothetical protein [Chitinispirillaceae bacterium]